MITYEINKPRPKSLVQEVKERIFGGVPPSTPYIPGQEHWEKLRYTKWLEEIIRPQWPRGTLCTVRGILPKPGAIPVPVYKVEELQEVCWMAPIADVTNEPRCVLLRMQKASHDVQVSYPPGLLRKLTDEETKLVHLRDQAEQPAPDLYAG